MRPALILALTLAACQPSPRTAAEFAGDRAAAETVVAACDAGQSRPDCDAARRGLAEAQRRERMAAWRSAF